MDDVSSILLLISKYENIIIPIKPIIAIIISSKSNFFLLLDIFLSCNNSSELILNRLQSIIMLSISGKLKFVSNFDIV